MEAAEDDVEGVRGVVVVLGPESVLLLFRVLEDDPAESGRPIGVELESGEVLKEGVSLTVL